MFRLLLLASLCWITVAGSTCPKGFKLFERNPTARNNHTKQWCLGVFEFNEDLGNRALARHFCVSFGASLSLPENQNEVDFVLKSYNQKEESGIAIDGEVSRKCKLQWYRTQVGFKNVTGECNLNKHLFEFDDANSDFTFLQQHFRNRIPALAYSRMNVKFSGAIGEFSACALLTKQMPDDEENGKLFYGDTSFCSGEKSNKRMNQKIRKAVCGRHPL